MPERKKLIKKLSRTHVMTKWNLNLLITHVSKYLSFGWNRRKERVSNPKSKTISVLRDKIRKLLHRAELFAAWGIMGFLFSP
jgi:hypothetical protein